MSYQDRYPKNFTRKELLKSETAARRNILNTPSSVEHENNLVSLAWFLQTLRDELCLHFNRVIPLVVSSGYRSEALNTLIGGSKRSAHCHGLAADFVALGLSVGEVVKFINEHRLLSKMVDQVIDEFDEWIHVGITQPKTHKKRNEFLVARKKGGRTVYTPYKA